MAKTRTQTGGAAVREHIGLVTHNKFHILVLVHRIQVDGLLQIRIHKAAINTAKGTFASVAALVKKNALQCNFFIVVFTDIQLILVHRQIRCTGAGARQINTETITCALALVSNQLGPRVSTVLIAVTADDSERLHRIIIRCIVRGTGADGNIQMAVVLRHIPDGTAIDTVRITVSGIVEHIRLRSDRTEAALPLGRVGGCKDQRSAFTGGSIHINIADDQLIVIDAHTTDTGRNTCFIRSTIILQRIQAHIDSLIAVICWVNLINAGQTTSAISMHTAAEIELIFVGHGITEHRRNIVHRLG